MVRLAVTELTGPQVALNDPSGSGNHPYGHHGQASELAQGPGKRHFPPGWNVSESTFKADRAAANGAPPLLPGAGDDRPPDP